jgi:hypothetical protein
MQILTETQARALRLRAQRLCPSAAVSSDDARGDAREAVGKLVGVQAQYMESAEWALGVRNRQLVPSDIEDARLGERSIVCTWGLRGTLHLMTAADLGWLLPLLGPVFVRKSRRRYDQLGLDEGRYVRARQMIEAILSLQGRLTRAELNGQLVEAGVSLEGQALYHALRRAGLEGILCMGPKKEGQDTYVLIDRWTALGPAMAEDQALAKLVRRYLLGYGPAGPEDLASWSGLSLRTTRAVFGRIAEELVPVEIGGLAGWMPRGRQGWFRESACETDIVRLLPSYDPYLLGYWSRDLIVSDRYARQIHPGGGMIRPTVILDGRAVGT